MEIVEFLKVLGDENRIRILNLLRAGELCVCEIEGVLKISQSNASRHLNKLSILKIISSRKCAQWVYYRLNDKTLNDYPFIKELLENECIKIEQCREDNESLIQYKKTRCKCEG